MIGALAVAVAISATPSAADRAVVGARLEDSAEAAQAFQGELDGGWRIEDATHRTLYILQITDPAERGRSLEGAWRGAADGAPLGVIAAIDRRGSTLTIRLGATDGAVSMTARLVKRRRGLWSGRLSGAGGIQPVVMERPPGRAAPT